MSQVRTTDKTPLMSIITPVYNRPDYLAAAIDGVLAQTFADWELIVIDDGSSNDENRNIAMRYCGRDDRIHYRYHAHGGISNARNHGVAAARGRYLAFLDSDDRYLPNGLEILINALQNAGPNVKMVYGNFIKYFQKDNRSQPIRARPPAPRPGLFFQFLLLGANPVAPCACLMYKSVLEEIGGFDSRFDSLEDRELWSRLVQLYDIAHVDITVAVYRKHAGQTTRNHSLRRLAHDRHGYHFFSAMPVESWFPSAIDKAQQAQALDELARLMLQPPLPQFDTALYLLRLAQHKQPDGGRQAFIGKLERGIPQILRSKFGNDERIVTLIP